MYVKGKDLGLADCLSRLSLPETCQSMDDELMVFKADTLTSSKHDVVAEATKRDDQLQIFIIKSSVMAGPTEELMHRWKSYHFGTLETNCQHIMVLSTVEKVL